MQPLNIALIATLLTIPSLGYAQEDPSASRGVFAPNKPTVAVPHERTFTLPGHGQISVPDHPVVGVPGPALAGQVVPSVIIPTPIPGQPGYGTAMVNGRRAIIQQGTNRIVQFLD
jgi:hypothetical protein